MKIYLEAIMASLFATAFAVVAVAGVAAVTVLDPRDGTPSDPAVSRSWHDEAVAGASIAPLAPTLRGGALAGAPLHPAPTPSATPRPSPTSVAATSAAPAPAKTVVGIASNYPGTAGWMGQATVALPGPLGGAYTGEVNGYVTVCADRCARLPVVDWCQCYWGTTDQRIVDLSHPAWALVSDRPPAEGLIEVRILLEG